MKGPLVQPLFVNVMSGVEIEPRGAFQMRRLLLHAFLPILVALTLGSEGKAQTGGIGIGVGVGSGFPGFGPGYGYGYGPYWGPGWGRGWYPGWYPGVFPGQMYGNYSNGLSMYGPPVPTYRSVPGMFGGADSRFFPPPSAYRPGFYNYAWMPIHRSPSSLSTVEIQKSPVVLTPATLPDEILQNGGLPKPLGVLTDAAPFELEIHVPNKDAQISINGQNAPGDGLIRSFKSSPVDAVDSHTMEVKATWTTPDGKISHTKRITTLPGERAKVVFKD